MDIEKLVTTLVWSYCVVGIIIVLGIFIYANFCMCDNTTTEELTILHKYSEDLLLGEKYCYIDTNETSYQMWGDATGVRYHLLERNKTYMVEWCGSGDKRVSCSEVKI